MVIFGNGVDKAKLFEIASKSNMKVEDSNTLNAIRVSQPVSPTHFIEVATEMGYTTELANAGALIVKEVNP